MARIVIIEDNAANLDLMIYLLRAFGHAPRGYPDGEAGLAALYSQPPDIVLCDIQLPKFDGFEIVARIRADEQLKHLPVIGVTAMAMRGDRERVLAAGFDGYIEKPIQPEAFVSQVESYLSSDLRGGRTGTPPPLAATYGDAEFKDHPAASVLAVDDVDENLDLLRTILEHGGYRVHCVHSPAEALVALRREPCDLIISDVHMPDGGGVALYQQSRAEPKLAGIPFVFISSTTTIQEELQLAAQLGACRLLQRPIEPLQLLRVVHSVLAQR
jgi:two-component system cell cycle response regulator